jgi:glycosyltransferase XagB
MSLDIFIFAIVAISLFQIFQGGLSLWQMVYGWSDPEKILRNQFPKSYEVCQTAFSVIIPCRHEAGVIGQTLIKMMQQRYPVQLFEVLVVMADDDKKTIAEVQSVAQKYQWPNVRLITFNSGPLNKSHGLNVALQNASGDYVAVFDAEDEVDSELLQAVNTVIVREGRKVIQTGVKLMNWKSNWFSLHAVLEYYFWFNSRLHWYADHGSITLGGVGIFVPHEVLTKVGGWDEDCLTEDAQLGIACSLNKCEFRILCDERKSIREEVPLSTESFIKQRTRWIQGFLQIFLAREWMKLPLIQQISFSTLVLFPFLQLFLLIWVVVAMVAFPKLPMPVVILSLLPVGLLLGQISMQAGEMVEMLRSRNQLRLFPFALGMFIVTYIPYQILIARAALRALIRQHKGAKNWEKTVHGNMNRTGDEIAGVIS